MVCNGGLASLSPPLDSARVAAHLNDWNRLSNEFGDTIGCAPATMPSLAGAAAGGGGSASAGFRGGRAAACFVVSGFGVAAAACFVVSGFGVAAAAVFGTEATWSLRLASMIFGFAGTAGCGLAAAVSAAPRPTLRARLLKKLSDCAFGAADATRVAGAGAGASEAASGSSGDVTGPRGGLTWEGMVPGARESATSDRPCPSPPSDSPVLPSGSLEANTLFMPPSMPVLLRATGVPLAISWAVSV